MRNSDFFYAYANISPNRGGSNRDISFNAKKYNTHSLYFYISRILRLQLMRDEFHNGGFAGNSGSRERKEGKIKRHSDSAMLIEFCNSNSQSVLRMPTNFVKILPDPSSSVIYPVFSYVAFRAIIQDRKWRITGNKGNKVTRWRRRGC